MTDKIVEYLQQLDLSEVEAQLYLKLLETGPISVRDLAKMTNLKRTTAYLHVDLLIEKGLVMKLVKGAHKMVAANNPQESLESLVNKKLETAKEMKVGFPEVMKDIYTSTPHMEEIGEAEIKYYKGKNGVRKIYEEALRAKELRSYVNVELLVNFLPGNGELFQKALQNSEIEVYEIISESAKSLEELHQYDAYKNYHYKILPENVKLSAADTLIYDGRVSIINAGEWDKATGIILRNNDYFMNSKELFDFIWQMLPDAK